MTLHPSRHCPALPDLIAAGVRGKVFLHEYIHPHPGKREAFIQHYVDHYLEATREAGRELVGIWGLARSANDVLILLAIADWDHHINAVVTRPDKHAETPWRNSAPAVRSDYDLRMLVPGPASINPLGG